MPAADDAINAVAASATWDARVALIRKIPEQFGTAEHALIYGSIAREAYVPHLAPDFAYVHWRDDYELFSIQDAYARGPVVRDTDGRVFFLPTLREMLTVSPFPDLVGTAPPPE